MRCIVQRVSKSSVCINQQIVAQIESGYLLLLGIESTDDFADIEWLCNKLIALRIFNDENGKMNLSIKDVNGDVILVSQFTLYASTVKGNRPSFTNAASPELAIPLYKKFIQYFELKLGKNIQTGEFGADMKVNLINDGPVTIILDTKNRT